MSKRKITMTKRFYTGSGRMTSTGDMHHKLGLYGEAIEIAKRRVEKDEEEVYIVEVVAVVRKERPPVIIDEVRRS